MKRLDLATKQRVWALQRPPYRPNPAQLEAHASDGEIVLVAGGERGGKSTWAAEELLPYVFAPPLGELRGYNYYLIGPTYLVAREEFGYLVDALDAVGCVAEAHMPAGEAQPWSLRTVHGNTVRTWSGHDPASIRSFAAHGIVLCEAGRLPYDVRLRVEGRLSETGGLLIMSGTFEGSLGWYPSEYQQGQVPNALNLRSYSLPSYANTAVFKGGREDPKILRLKAIYPDNVYKERVEAIPAPPSGVLFPEASWRLHVGIVEYTPGVRVDLAIDPGFSNAYAVVPLQEIEGVLRVVEGEVYVTQRSTLEVIQICRSRPWWPDVQGGTIDIAATQHRPDQVSKETEWDLWVHHAGLSLLKQAVPVETGIEAVRSFLQVHPVLGRSRLYIDRNNQGILSELGLAPVPDGIPNSGPWLYIKRPDGTATDKPEDRNNHALKALAYHLVSKYGAIRATDNTRLRERETAEAIVGRWNY